MFAEENGLHGDPRIKAISDAIRVVPHFPKPGIMFQDITTLLLDQKAFKYTVDIFVDRYRDKKISVVAGVEARGFIFGPPIALAIGAKFVPLRKPRKLPGEVISEAYVLEYGTDCLEMHVGAVQPGESVLIVDDLVATGGTLSAAIRLLERVGAEVVECACVIGLPQVKMSYTTVPFYSPEESLRLIMGKWKLTGQNYPVWKLHLENVLRAQGKLYVIDKPLSRPRSNAPEKEFAEYFKFMADESDVMSILSFSASPEFTVDLRVKFCHEVVKSIEDQVGFYRNSGKYLIMKEIFSLKLKRGQSVKDHLLEIRRLFKCLSRLGYKMTQEELVYLMWFSLPKEIRATASEYMGEPRMDVAKVHEDILDSLEPKETSADLMSTDWIDELGDLSCPECGSRDICVHSFNAGQMDIDLPDAPGIQKKGDSEEGSFEPTSR